MVTCQACRVDTMVVKKGSEDLFFFFFSKLKSATWICIYQLLILSILISYITSKVLCGVRVE